MRKFDLQLFTVDMIDRSGADALIPEQLSREIIQGAIEQSATLSRGLKLQNMTSKQFRLPVLDMLPMAYFVNGDSGMKRTTKAKWDKKFITAEEVAVIVPIPEAVLDDADYDIWGEIKPRMVEAFGRVIDGAILYGYGKPSTWRDSIVQTATAAGAVVTASGDVYEDIMGETGVIAKVEESGFFVSGHMADISMRAKLRGLRDSDGNPLFKSDMQGATNYTLDGSAMTFPRNGAFDRSQGLMITGDFDQLAYSIRQDVTYKLLDQAVIQDPETKEIVYNLAQQDMVALRAVMRLGWEIPNPINALKTNKNQRCPFAIYKATE